MNNDMSELIKAGEVRTNKNETITSDEQGRIDRALELASIMSKADSDAAVALAKETWGERFEDYIKDLVADSKVYLGRNYKKMLVMGGVAVVVGAMILTACMDPFVDAKGENTPVPGGTDDGGKPAESISTPTPVATVENKATVTVEPPKPTEHVQVMPEWLNGAKEIEIKGIGGFVEFFGDMSSVNIEAGDLFEVPNDVLYTFYKYILENPKEFEDLKPLDGKIKFDSQGGVDYVVVEKSALKRIGSVKFNLDGSGSEVIGGVYAVLDNEGNVVPFVAAAGFQYESPDYAKYKFPGELRTNWNQMRSRDMYAKFMVGISDELIEKSKQYGFAGFVNEFEIWNSEEIQGEEDLLSGGQLSSKLQSLLWVFDTSY